MSEETPAQPPVAQLEYEHTAFEDIVRKNARKLWLAGGLALVISLGWLGNKLWTEHRNNQAARALKAAGTVPELKQVAESHAGQPAAGTALLEAAVKVGAEHPGEAVDLLKKLVGDYPEHPLVDLAHIRMGQFLRGNDKLGALAAFEKVKSGSAFYDQAVVAAGDVKWELGKPDEALAAYEKIRSSSEQYIDATQRKRYVKMKAPTLIPYVEEKPAPGAAGASQLGMPGMPNLMPSIPSTGGISNINLSPEGVPTPGADEGIIKLDPTPALPVPSVPLPAEPTPGSP